MHRYSVAKNKNNDFDSIVSLIATILFLTGSTGLGGCRQNAASRNDNHRFENRVFAATNWSLELQSLPNPETSEKNARAAWLNIFQAMADDKQTLKLLKRLHGGQAVQWVVVNSKQAKLKQTKLNNVLSAAPSEGFTVVIRVGDITANVESIPGGLSRVFAFGRVMSVNHNRHETEPSPGTALILCMQEYLFRNVPGWTVGGNSMSFDDSNLYESLEQQQAVLDARIAAYASESKEFFASLE